MTFTATFVLIFLVAFVLIGGVVMYLSKTIDHGEARFDASGKVIRDAAKTPPEEVKPAQRIEEKETKAKDNE